MTGGRIPPGNPPPAASSGNQVTSASAGQNGAGAANSNPSIPPQTTPPQDSVVSGLHVAKRRRRIDVVREQQAQARQARLNGTHVGYSPIYRPPLNVLAGIAGTPPFVAATEGLRSAQGYALFQAGMQGGYEKEMIAYLRRGDVYSERDVQYAQEHAHWMMLIAMGVQARIAEPEARTPAQCLALDLSAQSTPAQFARHIASSTLRDKTVMRGGADAIVTWLQQHGSVEPLVAPAMLAAWVEHDVMSPHCTIWCVLVLLQGGHPVTLPRQTMFEHYSAWSSFAWENHPVITSVARDMLANSFRATLGAPASIVARLRVGVHHGAPLTAVAADATWAQKKAYIQSYTKDTGATERVRVPVLVPAAQGSAALPRDYIGCIPLLLALSPADWKKPFDVAVVGHACRESDKDVCFRTWITEILRWMLYPKRSDLFVVSGDPKGQVLPNPMKTDAASLHEYRVVGRLLAKMMGANICVSHMVPLPIRKMMIGRQFLPLPPGDWPSAMQPDGLLYGLHDGIARQLEEMFAGFYEIIPASAFRCLSDNEVAYVLQPVQAAAAPRLMPQTMGASLRMNGVPFTHKQLHELILAAPEEVSGLVQKLAEIPPEQQKRRDEIWDALRVGLGTVPAHYAHAVAALAWLRDDVIGYVATETGEDAARDIAKNLDDAWVTHGLVERADTRDVPIEPDVVLQGLMVLVDTVLPLEKDSEVRAQLEDQKNEMLRQLDTPDACDVAAVLGAAFGSLEAYMRRVSQAALTMRLQQLASIWVLSVSRNGRTDPMSVGSMRSGGGAEHGSVPVILDRHVEMVRALWKLSLAQGMSLHNTRAVLMQTADTMVQQGRLAATDGAWRSAVQRGDDQVLRSIVSAAWIHCVVLRAQDAGHGIAWPELWALDEARGRVYGDRINADLMLAALTSCLPNDTQYGDRALFIRSARAEIQALQDATAGTAVPPHGDNVALLPAQIVDCFIAALQASTNAEGKPLITDPALPVIRTSALRVAAWATDASRTFQATMLGAMAVDLAQERMPDERRALYGAHPMADVFMRHVDTMRHVFNWNYRVCKPHYQQILRQRPA